jgi:LysM repeat protein
MLTPAITAFARSYQTSSVSAYDLIAAMNSLRVSYGYGALIEDSIVDAVAQSTAQIMAANEMSWHIGDVRGRLAAAGYGGGATVWATENFAVGYDMSMADIMSVWSDSAHMLPATTAAYCNVGAGTALAPNGMTYYVLQAAYVAGKSCGSYTSGSGSSSGSSGSTSPTFVVPQIIYPVEVATPDADGRIYHVVRDGQSLWAIAIAYHVTIKDLETYNNLSSDSIQIGQKLFIPSSNTVGYATPTPVGMVQVSTPDANGKVVHVVEAYQTLSTIAQAYKVSLNTILALNGIKETAVLQIGQKLLINPGVSTPTPTTPPFNPLSVLTPVSDGQYTYVVKNGENLSYIAKMFEINVADLMSWNGLNDSSIIQPGENLLLKLTLPPTQTATTIPASATPVVPTATRTPAPSRTPTQTTATVTPTAAAVARGDPSLPAGFIVAGLFVVGLSLATWFFGVKNKKFFKGK